MNLEHPCVVTPINRGSLLAGPAHIHPRGLRDKSHRVNVERVKNKPSILSAVFGIKPAFPTRQQAECLLEECEGPCFGLMVLVAPQLMRRDAARCSCHQLSPRFRTRPMCSMVYLTGARPRQKSLYGTREWKRNAQLRVRDWGGSYHAREEA